MTTPLCSVPASTPVVDRSGPAPSGRPSSSRPVAGGRGAGVGPGSVAPAAGRRDGVRPAGRPARLEGLAVLPVRGGCGPEIAAGPGAGAERWDDGVPAPLRLTRRGRRVLSGLSIGIGLSIAVATAAVQLAHPDGGLQLAGSSTVVVQSGDTLWSLAERVAPEEDPRAVVDAVVDLNGLEDVDLVPGMVLQLP